MHDNKLETIEEISELLLQPENVESDNVNVNKKIVGHNRFQVEIKELKVKLEETNEQLQKQDLIIKNLNDNINTTNEKLNKKMNRIKELEAYINNNKKSNDTVQTELDGELQVVTQKLNSQIELNTKLSKENEELTLNIENFEVLSDTGWEDIKSLHTTIDYQVFKLELESSSIIMSSNSFGFW